MSVRKLRSCKKRRPRRVPTPLWFQRSDLFDAEFDSEGEKNAAEDLSRRKSKVTKGPLKDNDLEPLNVFSRSRLKGATTDSELDEDSDGLFKPIGMESESDSDIEWLPDLPDDGVSLPASHKRNNNSNNKRKSVMIIDSDTDDECRCSKSTGNTQIMCKFCRVKPLSKKPKLIDLTSPTEPTEEIEIIAIDSSPEKEDNSGIKIPNRKRHYLDPLSPTTSSKIHVGFSNIKASSTPVVLDSDRNSSDTGRDIDRNRVVNKSGPRHVNAVTRNKRKVNGPYHGEDGRTLSGEKCLRLPCLLATSHASIGNPGKRDMERRVLPYEIAKLYALQACQPDSGDSTRKQKLGLLKMVKDFCTKKEEPPNELIRSLLELLIDTRDDKLAIRIHKCLLEMMEVNPPVKRNGSNELPFDWPMVGGIMEKLNLNMAVFDKFRETSPATTLANTLALDYIVSHLESDLVHRPMTKQMQITKSAAAVFFKEPNEMMHKVIRYLQMAIISYNEYDQLLIERLSLDRSDSEYRLPLTDIEKVVPLLQRLLDLLITTSKVNPVEIVNDVVTDLKRVWRMCCVEKRKLLLNTLVSPLVKLKLVYLILMDTDGAFGDDVPGSFDTMHDIVSFFGYVRPFCIGTADTPPNSPRSPHEQNPAGHNDAEEIAMLLYTAVTSYIKVVKGNLRAAPNNRSLEAQKKHDLSDSDMRQIKHFGERIEELRNCLQSIVGPGMALSSRTLMYLEQMKCIQDLSDTKYKDLEVIVL